MSYFFKKISIFDFKIMAIFFFLNNRIIKKNYTFKQITFVKIFNFLSNKNNLLVFSDYPVYFLIGMIEFSINNMLTKKKNYQINGKYFFPSTRRKIHKIIGEIYVFLSSTFNSYKYVRFILKKKALFKQAFIIHINDKCNTLFSKKIKYRKNKVFILKRFINHTTTHIQIKTSSLNISYKQKIIFFCWNFFSKRYNLAVVAWFILKEKCEINNFLMLKIFFYFVKKNKNLKKTWHKYFSCFNLFEKLYRKILLNIRYSIVFWMCRFNIEFKIKHNLFNFSIIQSLICFILLKKVHKNNNRITDHFIQIIIKKKKSIFRFLYISLLPNKFFLANWNIQI
jgi:hypothetical protein